MFKELRCLRGDYHSESNEDVTPVVHAREEKVIEKRRSKELVLKLVVKSARHLVMQM